MVPGRCKQFSLKRGKSPLIHRDSGSYPEPDTRLFYSASNPTERDSQKELLAGWIFLLLFREVKTWSSIEGGNGVSSEGKEIR